jgi:hypothetical protein
MPAMMKCQRDDLVNLLKKTQRQQVVAGKKQNQVYSCILKTKDNTVVTTSLVKDGVTSISRFSMPVEVCDGDIPISNIDDMLGVLSMHGQQISLSFYSPDKLKVTSRTKQTTIKSNLKSLAFPHNPETLSEWVQNSESKADKFILGHNISYKTNDGTIIEPFYVLNVSANVLYEALRCDGINSQKLNRYTFTLDEDGVCVEVGNELRGKTSTILSGEPVESRTLCVVNGGLENALKLVDGDILLSFISIAGVPSLAIGLGDGDFIFQAGNRGTLQ